MNRNMIDPAAMDMRPRVFPSMMDWLDPMVPVKWLADFLDLIHQTPNLNWLLLTKRPELWADRMLAVSRTGNRECGLSSNGGQNEKVGHCVAADWLENSFNPKNVWIGVTCEDQTMADCRIPVLITIPARVRFLSLEPLLEPVTLTAVRFGDCGLKNVLANRQPAAHLDWVIVGGESGDQRRNCGVEAIIHVAEQCQAAGVPCFVKQDCARMPGTQGGIPDKVWKLKQFPTLSP
jgi:protein gp37